MTIKDLTTFNMLEHLTDLDSMVNYWSILDAEPESYEKEAGFDILGRAVSKFVTGGSGALSMTIPATIATKEQLRKWLLKLKLGSVPKTGIGSIGNCYGSLEVFSYDSKFYWTIDCPAYGASYEEIPKSLYDELINFGDTQ